MRSAPPPLALVLILLVVALPAAAATVTITPASPDTTSILVATTDAQTICMKPAHVTVIGNVIRAVHAPTDDCNIIATPLLFPSKVTIGALPAGDYTYELSVDDGLGPPTLLATATFTVAAGPPLPSVPLIDSYGLAFLSALFVLVGAIAVGRFA